MKIQKQFTNCECKNFEKKIINLEKKIINLENELSKTIKIKTF